MTMYETGTRRTSVLLLVLLSLLLVVTAALTPPASGAESESEPAIRLSQPQAGKGGEITVSGSGWRPDTLLMLLICGQNMIGGTDSCANADGRAVTTDAQGSFSKKLPVAEPPKPCPCVVHVATVMGEQAAVDEPFTVAGHPTAPLPEPAGGGKLAVLATTRLEGDSGVLVFFGAPPSRHIVFTVGNLGTTPVEDPVFRLGTSHGVYAPQWEEQQWRGTIQPGRKALVKLPVELAAGAHGDYEISVKYGDKLIVAQPWGVSRPWGVTVFWVLLAIVVPAALFRIGMAVVDRVRPDRGAAGRRTGGRGRTDGRGERPRGRGPRGQSAGGQGAKRAGRHRTRPAFPEVTVKLPALLGRSSSPGGRPADPEGERARTAAPPAGTTPTAALPWFTPDSAPSENRPPTKGHS
ncbi:neocarzinostatin apoprotein domain-containing protein [Streptomyces sp. NPDC051018]|uniref:neocarzinostatin apoprotein domain-containing protein n=1 Tax=Streptomyces sp. NPDC051018 TaxID=3365639 RepID=UPI0037B3EE46